MLEIGKNDVKCLGISRHWRKMSNYFSRSSAILKKGREITNSPILFCMRIFLTSAWNDTVEGFYYFIDKDCRRLCHREKLSMELWLCASTVLAMQPTSVIKYRPLSS